MSFFSNQTRFQKTKLIFIGVYFIFNLVILIVSFRLSLDNIRFLVDVSKLIPYAKYIASLGMVLFLGMIIIQYIEVRKVRNELNKNVKEVHLLKSKLYDMDEKEKKDTKVIPEPDSEEPESK